MDRIEKELKKQIKIWVEWVGRQENNKFVLNPDEETVKMLAKGVLINEKNNGFKYCPCRMISGNLKEDAKLICPCNFKIQKTWKENGECWCSLFVKEKNGIKKI